MGPTTIVHALIEVLSGASPKHSPHPAMFFSLSSCLFITFNCAVQVLKHYNGENETFCVKCGLIADHFSSLVRMRTKFAIGNLFGPTAENQTKDALKWSITNLDKTPKYQKNNIEYQKLRCRTIWQIEKNKYIFQFEKYISQFETNTFYNLEQLKFH